MKAIKHFFTEKEEHFHPGAFIVAVIALLTFVGTTFYIMASSLTS
jgi:hypothetical protein